MIATTVSTLVLGGKPVLVVDVSSEREDLAALAHALDDPLLRSFHDRGFRLLPGFLGVAMPEVDGTTLVLRAGQVAMVTDDGHEVLAVPVDDLPHGWLDAATAHGGALAFIGHAVAVAQSQDAPTAAQRIHAASTAGRVVGGVVGLDPAGSDLLGR